MRSRRGALNQHFCFVCVKFGSSRKSYTVLISRERGHERGHGSIGVGIGVRGSE